LRNKNGCTLVESLVSMAILSFVVASILSVFTHQMFTNRRTGNRNIAITLAEAKIEEFLKFPSSQIPLEFPASVIVPPGDVDYIFYSGNRTPVVSTVDPQENNQFRRTVEVVMNGNLCGIRVVVDFGYIIKDNFYPFRLVLSTQRGL
jgi:type II secretory pathway pseudopilin PulG